VADLTDAGDFPVAVPLFDADIDLSNGLLDLESNLPHLGSDDLGHAQQAPTDLVPAQKDESPALPWFVQPSSWRRERAAPQQDDVTASSQQMYVDTIRNWLFDWVSGSSSSSTTLPLVAASFPCYSSSSNAFATDSPAANPLIHPELYRHDMPRVIQDAYTAISTYQHRTPANAATALRILELRTEQLIQEQEALHEAEAVVEVGGRSGSGSSGLDPTLGMTTREHLARVHALLAYQTLRLFDGDVRARARADDLVDTLLAWCDAMWASAEKTMTDRKVVVAEKSRSSMCCDDGGYDYDHYYSDNDDPSCSQDDLSWHVFILVESVRRTFVAARIVLNIYLLQKLGWSNCPGGVVLTLRRGVWSARSAYAWRKKTASFLPATEATATSTEKEKDPLLGLLTTRLEDALQVVGPGDVDDFGLALLGVHFGEERLERWVDEKGSTDLSLSGPLSWL
jgi:hypothetical protein